MEAVLIDTEILSVRTDRMTPHVLAKASRESSPVRTVNATIRELSRASEPIAFFCECRDPTCFGAVWMTSAAFDVAIAGHTGWMLLEGHAPSALWHTREPPPAPGARRALRAVPDTEAEAPAPTKKSRGASLHHRLARAS